jgi:PKHD-type hydroxylase
MMLRIPALLDASSVAAIRGIIDAAEWTDGNVTSGRQAAQAKRNMQLPEKSPAARQAGDMIMAALEKNGRFFSGALPLKVFPPLFNRYDSGMNFATHIDNSIRFVPGAPVRVRTDLSATVFLTDPAEYDGGELTILDTFGEHSVKLTAGDMVLYSATSRHHVMPVTRGCRVSSFFWIQSMVRDERARTLLFELDSAIQGLRKQVGDNEELVSLTGLYHNLLRRWADA